MDVTLLIERILAPITKKFVGVDDFGNKYYLAKFKDINGEYRRSVIYKGIVDSSKVPPMWHAWLHYSSDEFPLNAKIYDWQKDHLPNLTGTKFAYDINKNITTNTRYKPWVG